MQRLHAMSSKMSSVASHLQAAREGCHEDFKKGSEDEEHTEDEEMEQEEYVDIENSEDEDEEDMKTDLKTELKTDLKAEENKKVHQQNQLIDDETKSSE